MAPSDGHICNSCKWCQHMAKFATTNASGAIWWPNLLLMQVAPSGGQTCNLCKWRHLVAIFATNASGAIRWPYLQLMEVAPSGGQICNFCKWRHLVAKFATNVSGAKLLPSPIQVTKSISGSVVPPAMFYHLLAPFWICLQLLAIFAIF